MRRNSCIVIVLLLVLFPVLAESAITRTESFRVSLTIPVLVGINDDQEQTQINGAVLTGNQDITYERAVRENKRVILKTIVAK